MGRYGASGDAGAADQVLIGSAAGPGADGSLDQLEPLLLSVLPRQEGVDIRLATHPPARIRRRQACE